MSTGSIAAVNENIIKSTADIMVKSGLIKAGYDYLVIDGRDLICSVKFTFLSSFCPSCGQAAKSAAV